MNLKFNFFVNPILSSFFLYQISSAQILHKDSFRMDVQPNNGLASNTVSDILVYSNTIWLGTGAGLSRTFDGGQSFISYGEEQGIGKGGVSAIAVSDEVIWVATGFDTTTEFGEFQAGGGLAFSLDDGENWTLVPQPGLTNVQNITFDIALRDSEIWITSFGGGLRRADTFGQSLETITPDSFIVVTPDSFLFDPLANLNHRAFSVINVDGTLWVGTAGGINRSTDGGLTWTNFSHGNQTEPISGNFVVAIANQRYRGKNIIWAATVETTSETQDTTEFRGISWSKDQGFTWSTALRGEFAHNFAFDDSVVYVVTDNGLFKSIDEGEIWALFPNIVNEADSRQIFANEFFAVGVSAGHTVWAGTPDGLAKTSDNGVSWEVFQTFEPTGREGSARTYAYPNPFSPNVHNELDGFGHVRFQYNTTKATRVSLKIYDFAMELVTIVVENKSRSVGDFYEIWDGRDARGFQVDNGIYFYRIDLEGDGSFWGKLIVLN